MHENIDLHNTNFLYCFLQVIKVVVSAQGIIDCKGMETQQIFFFCVSNGKNIKELFGSTLNRITASARCVSSVIVVLNAKLTRLIVAHTSKKTAKS